MQKLCGTIIGTLLTPGRQKLTSKTFESKA